MKAEGWQFENTNDRVEGMPMPCSDLVFLAHWLVSRTHIPTQMFPPVFSTQNFLGIGELDGY